MFAVIASGGKQHRVSKGEVLRLEKIDSEVGDTIEFEQVLMLAADDQVKIGAPYLEGKVLAEVMSHGLAKKINVIKFHRRKGYRRKQGHRQGYTEVKIKDILA